MSSGLMGLFDFLLLWLLPTLLDALLLLWMPYYPCRWLIAYFFLEPGRVMHLFWKPCYPVRLLPCSFSTWSILMVVTYSSSPLARVGDLPCTYKLGRRLGRLQELNRSKPAYPYYHYGTRCPLTTEHSSSVLSFVLSFWFGLYCLYTSWLFCLLFSFFPLTLRCLYFLLK